MASSKSSVCKEHYQVSLNAPHVLLVTALLEVQGKRWPVVLLLPSSVLGADADGKQTCGECSVYLLGTRTLAAMASWDSPDPASHLQCLERSFVSRLCGKSKILVEIIEATLGNRNYIEFIVH